MSNTHYLTPILASSILGITVLSCGKPSASNLSGNPSCRLVEKPAAQLNLFLADSVSYDTQVKPILATNCEGCHSGANQPTFNTYTLTKIAIDAILDSVTKGRMPLGADPLDGDTIAVLEAWKAGGMPQRISATGETPPAAGEKSPEEDESGEPTETKQSAAAPQWTSIDSSKFDVLCDESLKVLNLNDTSHEALLKKAEVSSCQRTGYLFDRSAGTCSRAKVASSYTCSRTGLFDAFAKTPRSLRSVLEQSLGSESNDEDFGEFFTIDQCGEFEDGTPLVFLVRVVETDGKKELQVRELSLRE